MLDDISLVKSLEKTRKVSFVTFKLMRICMGCLFFSSSYLDLFHHVLIPKESKFIFNLTALIRTLAEISLQLKNSLLK